MKLSKWLLSKWLWSLFLTGPTIKFYVDYIKTWSLPVPEKEMISDWRSIGPDLSIIFAVWGTGLLILINWAGIKHLITAKRRAREAEIEQFQNLRAELRALRQLMRNVLREPNPFEWVHSEVTSVFLKLNDLGIPCAVIPTGKLVSDFEIREASANWRKFLDVLIPLADMGKLESARRIIIAEEGIIFAP